jgi:hemolysin-activating ACP:hemolysin acyltransferase
MQLQKAVLDSLFLFNQSPDHRIYTLVEFNHYALFPIMHDKARLFYEDDKPVGFVTWAWLIPEESEAFLSETWVPDEEVYKRPDKALPDLELWGIEYIAPYGHALQVMRGMRQHSQQLYGPNVPVHWRRFRQPDRLHRRIF